MGQVRQLHTWIHRVFSSNSKRNLVALFLQEPLDRPVVEISAVSDAPSLMDVQSCLLDDRARNGRSATVLLLLMRWRGG